MIKLQLLNNLIVLCAISFTWLASAGESAQFSAKTLCPTVQIQAVNGSPVWLFQNEFDGVQELAIGLPSNNLAFDIKRITFGGSTSPVCHYSNMAIVRGGDWGWHLAWFKQNEAVLNYARMDGIAWVSSPIKKLSKHVNRVNQPTILTFEQHVWVVWSELATELVSDSGDKVHHVYVAFSGDEGRTWGDAKLLRENSDPIDKFELLVKESQPYLTWGNNTEAVLLPIGQ